MARSDLMDGKIDYHMLPPHLSGILLSGGFGFRLPVCLICLLWHIHFPYIETECAKDRLYVQVLELSRQQ
jgi:hypothetical protein